MNILDMEYESNPNYMRQHSTEKKKHRSICDCLGDVCSKVKEKLIFCCEWILQAQAEQYKYMKPEHFRMIHGRHF